MASVSICLCNGILCKPECYTFSTFRSIAINDKIRKKPQCSQTTWKTTTAFSTSNAILYHLLKTCFVPTIAILLHFSSANVTTFRHNKRNFFVEINGPDKVKSTWRRYPCGSHNSTHYLEDLRSVHTQRLRKRTFFDFFKNILRT